MRFILSLLMIYALAAFTACQGASSTTVESEKKTTNEKKVEESVEKIEKKEEKAESQDNQESDDEAPRISLEDAKKAFDKGEVVFIDTRSALSYQNEHIEGAVNLPAGDFEKEYNKIPKGKKIIAYCS